MLNVQDELDILMGDLGATAVDQETLEREVAVKADMEIIGQAIKEDERRLDKAKTEKEKQEYMLQLARERRNMPTTPMSERRQIDEQIDDLEASIGNLNTDIADITQRVLARVRERQALSDEQVDTTEQRLPNEPDRDFLIRTGKITPFDRLPGLERKSTIATEVALSETQISAQNLRRPGFDHLAATSEPVTTASKRETASDNTLSDLSEVEARPKKRLRKRKASDEDDGDDEDYAPEPSKKQRPTQAPKKKLVRKWSVSLSEPDYSPSDDSEEDYYVGGYVATKPKKKKIAEVSPYNIRLDDGDENQYQKRLREWVSQRSKARQHAHSQLGETHLNDNADLEEWRRPHPTKPDQVFSGDFKLPGDIHPSLFAYQGVAVQWLWELHCQGAGGILGDEMGLGKTIQVIAFIAGLHYSGLLDKPCIVVAPGAVLKQWATEFHVWWPALRVSILHKSGSGMLHSKDNEAEYDEDGFGMRKSSSAAKKIVNRVFRDGHILITTYEGLTTYGDILLDRQWSYAVLDEGHKIRNPDAKVSLTCKQLKTPHRLILSGTPIQNNLVELWSLFDFVFPGRLGTLPIFKEQFEVPIRIGGYKNASNTQVQTASECAAVLRRMIGPYLLRRLKMDVLRDLPTKQELVLFCDLTPTQTEYYKEYLASPEVKKILAGELQSLSGISVLRKICSHPDLVDREILQKKEGYRYGDPEHSGKMQVAGMMLKLWKAKGHRTLLFSQSVQILDILEKEIRNSEEGFKFRRMDGSTPIQSRQELVDEFNDDTSIDVFLMTTRVGGLGLNLTGADRVIIFDPDWNPSTDLQARERAWRIGQKKPVSIFRLVAAGTIEEKMYHRQLFKNHLAQKVLTNAAQRRVFESDTLHDLFTLTTKKEGTTTGAMFQGAETVNRNPRRNNTTTSTERQDLTRLTGVASLENYAIPDDSTATEKEKESGEKQFIDQIFSHVGVLSSLEHDKAFEPALPQDTSLSAQYAASVARNAAKKLEESVRIAQAASIGTLTWTGSNGTAGREQVPQRASASGLLGKLKKKGQPSESSRSATPQKLHSPVSGSDTRSMRAQMLDAFLQKRGKLTTREVKEWCRERSISGQDIARAKEMRTTLRDLSIMNKETHEHLLKREFRARV